MDKLSILLGISLTINLVFLGIFITFRRVYNNMNDAWQHLLNDILDQMIDVDNIDDEELN